MSTTNPIQSRILVLGGTQGIGAAISTSYVEQGHHVLATYLNNSQEAELLVKQCATLPGTIQVIKADSASASQLDELVNTHCAPLGKFSLAVVCATPAHPPPTRMRKRTDQDERLTQQALAVATEPLYFLARHHKTFLDSQSHIIVINTEFLTNRSYSTTGQATYMVAKGAQWALARTLSHELRKQHILVSILCPGMADTKLLRKQYDQRALDILIESIPGKRLLKSDEIAEAIHKIHTREPQKLEPAIYQLTPANGLIRRDID